LKLVQERKTEYLKAGSAWRWQGVTPLATALSPVLFTSRVSHTHYAHWFNQEKRSIEILPDVKFSYNIYCFLKVSQNLAKMSFKVGIKSVRLHSGYMAGENDENQLLKDERGKSNPLRIKYSPGPRREMLGNSGCSAKSTTRFPYWVFASLHCVTWNLEGFFRHQELFRWREGGPSQRPPTLHKKDPAPAIILNTLSTKNLKIN
jgi:hypothetical protein